MTSLILRNNNIDNDVSALQTVAKYAVESGLYTAIGAEAKIFMILMSAKELGIQPMQALNGGLWNIKGKVEISARMVNSMLRKAGLKISIKRLDTKGCILIGTRPDTGDTCTISFLEEDAKLAGVLSRDVWRSHPEDMYFARAISKLGRRLAPDILGTAYVEGEIAEENEKLAYTKPEELQEVACEEVETFKQEQSTAYTDFISSWGSDAKDFESFFDAGRKAYKTKSDIEIVNMLKADLNGTNAKFEAWKARQADKARKLAEDQMVA
jgi:hypothetical protein